jgi:molecular chaperone GrpE
LQNEKEKYLRLFAEFENFKKRTSRERIELFKTANKEVMSALIPIMDDYDRAKSQINNENSTDEIKGLLLIFNKMNEILKTNGLNEVEISVGDIFDSEIHEAITQIPAQDESQKGKVMDVLEKGYQLGEKIIRFPKVVVGK